MAIESLMSNGRIGHNDDVGIVIDFDLGLIDRYNARNEPFIDDTYIGNNLELLYASADSSKKHSQNVLISHADRVATLLLNKIKTEFSDRGGLQELIGHPMTHVRVWRPSPPDVE